MRVKIGDQWFSPSEAPILVCLNKQDVEALASMRFPDEKTYAVSCVEHQSPLGFQTWVRASRMEADIFDAEEERIAKEGTSND